MDLPVYVVVAQWTLLATFALLLIIVFRQLGRVIGHDERPAQLGPATGTPAASFEYKRIRDQSLHDFAPGGGKPTLLAFVEPTCLACEHLVENLGSAADAGELSDFRVLLLTFDPPSYLQISDALSATRLELGRVVGHDTRAAYNATATPLVVAISQEGIVRAAGPARDRADIRAFASACLLSAPQTALAVVETRSGPDVHSHLSASAVDSN